MRKAIALKKSDEKISAFLDAVHESKARFQQKMMFIKKQSEQAQKEFVAEQESIWTELRERLKEVGMMPAEYREGDTLSYDREGEVLYWIREEDDGGLKKFIATFFGDVT